MIDYRSEMKRFFWILVGVAFYIFGVSYFLIPSKLIATGTTGYSMFFQRILSGVDINLPLGVILFIVEIPALVTGLFGLNRKFVVYSIIAILIETVMFSIIHVETSIFPNDLIASAIFGGIFIGIGAGITLSRGASLGGIDIISQYVSLKKHVPIVKFSLLANGLLILISLIYFDVSTALYTVLGFGTSSLVVEKIHTAYKRVKLEIITSEGVVVKETLLKSYQRGITVCKGVGAYSGRKKMILITVVQSHEVYDIKKSILEVDPQAFILMNPIKHLSGKFMPSTIK